MSVPDRMSAAEYRKAMGVDSPAPSSAEPRRKYGNVPTVVDGETLDSKLEARRFETLRDRERAGVICELQRQVPYALTVQSYLIGSYIADFVYYDCSRKRVVVEDCKSKATATPLFQWKKRHMRAEHKIDIAIIERPDA